LLRNLARQRLELLRAKNVHSHLDGVDLLDFVPAVSPHLMRPQHLSPFAEVLERACEPGQLRTVVAAPPQHGKTEMVTHGLLWLAKRYPGRRHGYVTYSNERAEYVSAALQRLAEAAGLEPQGRLSDVRLKGGTQIRFTSIGGSFTGFPVDGLLVIDDPFKDRADAESPTIRRKTIEWFIDVARSRRHPKTSIICMATRWHPEDLSGELIRRGYEYINLKAIAEGPLDDEGRVANDPLHRFAGESLFPELKPPSFFEEERLDAYSWNSLYQGEPRGRGHSVFKFPDIADPEVTFREPPRDALIRICIGCDFAYTAKTHADWSVAVVLGQAGPNFYVLDVIRTQEEPANFRSRLELIAVGYEQPRLASYVAGTERGAIEFIRETTNLPIQELSANRAGDKFTRAIPVAAAWNSGRILIPQSAPWLDAFLAEVTSFTGVKDRNDDQVDALASAFDGLRFVPPIDIEYLNKLNEALPKTQLDW
jgi:predicted phage terminase large subunit-like protein